MVIANISAGDHVITARWAEEFVQRDERTGDEIAEEIVEKLGLLQGGGE